MRTESVSKSSVGSGSSPDASDQALRPTVLRSYNGSFPASRSPPWARAHPSRTHDPARRCSSPANSPGDPMTSQCLQSRPPV